MVDRARESRARVAWRVAHWAVLLGASAVALYAVAVLAHVFASRLAYPMDIEWSEGGTLLHAHQLLHEDEGLFGPDHAVFLPYPYPPGYPLLIALFSVLGLDFWTGRLVSILCFAGFCAVLFTEVRRQLEHKLDGACLGLMAVATAVVAYPVVGGWYDLVRVDSAFMGLSALGAWGVSAERYTTRRMLATAAVLTLAIYTKQTAAIFAVWIVLFALIRDWRKGALLCAATLLACALALGLLQWRSDGHFWRWIFSNLASHEVKDERFWEGVELLHGFAPFAAPIPAAAAVLAWRRRLSRRSLLWLGMLVCAVPVSLLPYAKVGGYINNLMPMVMLVGPVAVLLVTDVIRRPWRLSRPLSWIALALLSVFVWMRPIEPADYIPDQDMRARAVALNEMIASLEGGVLIPHLPFLAVRHGHTNLHFHVNGYRDLDAAGRTYDIVQTLERAGAEWLILASRDRSPMARTMRETYRAAGEIPTDMRVGMMIGYEVVLDELYRRRHARPE